MSTAILNLDAQKNQEKALSLDYELRNKYKGRVYDFIDKNLSKTNRWSFLLAVVASSFIFITGFFASMFAGGAMGALCKFAAMSIMPAASSTIKATTVLVGVLSWSIGAALSIKFSVKTLNDNLFSHSLVNSDYYLKEITNNLKAIILSENPGKIPLLAYSIVQSGTGQELTEEQIKNNQHKFSIQSFVLDSKEPYETKSYVGKFNEHGKESGITSRQALLNGIKGIKKGETRDIYPSRFKMQKDR
ncbi:MAG: hypothetical protein AAF443_05610 [Chlamydiota bacterium]